MSKTLPIAPHGHIEIPEPDALLQLYDPPIVGTSARVTEIIERLVTMIRRGELAPGQRLIEADLTREFDVVRGRVREALLILSGEGMVELVPQRGARVARLQPGGLVHYLEVLEAIASKGMELFGRRYGKPEGEIADALRAAYERIEEAGIGGSPIEVHLRAAEFHVLINHLSGNPELNALIAKFRILIYARQLGDILGTETRVYIIEPHREIVQKMLEGRTCEAIDALRTYVRALVLRIQSGADGTTPRT